MSLTEHLAELRRRLFICLVSVALFTLLLLIPAPTLITLLVHLDFPGITLHAFGPTDVIGAEVRFAFYGGIALSLPVLLYQTWQFVAPAIEPTARRRIIFGILPSPLLALGGIAFCHVLILPRIVATLLSMTMAIATPTFGIGPTLNLILGLFFAFALIFQTPLVLVTLARLNLISSSLLRRFRRHTIMATLLIGGIAAPDGSPLTMLLLALPLYALYEVSIVLIAPLERHAPTQR